MRLLLPAVAALLVLQQGAAAPPHPRELIHRALQAVETDSTAAFEARWSRALRRDSANREALLSLGALARLTYRHARADTLLERVVAARDGDVLADYASIERGHSLMMRARFRDAVATYERVQAGATSRGDSVAAGEALLGMAGPRSRMMPPAAVIASLERAERLVAGEPAMVANARCQRAALLGRMGDPGATGVAQAGEALARTTGDRRQQARCLQAQAQILSGVGNQPGAIELLGRAAPLFEQARDRASLGSLLQWRGFLLNGLGRYGEARVALTRALEEGARAQAGNVVGWSLINLGMIALGMGDRVTATEELTRAAEALEDQGDEFGVSMARSMLGGVARSAGDTTAARVAYARVLEWANGAGDVHTQFNMHEALASIAEMSGNWVVAERELDTSRAIARAHRMGSLSTVHYRTGRLALRRGRWAEAERSLRASLAMTDSSERPWLHATRALIAEAMLGRGDVAGAERELVAASDELDRWRAGLSDHDLRVRAMEFEHGIDPDLGIATVIAGLAGAGRVPTAFALAERRRARELVDGIHRARALETQAATDGALTPMGTGGAALDPRTFLPDDSTALLEYVTGRGHEPTTIFIVTRAGITARRTRSIDSLSGDLHRFITLLEADGDVRPIGTELGRVLLEPALAGLSPAIRRLLIVPDDILARLPFDALVLADGRFAIERFAIGFAPSAGALAALRSRPARERPVRLLAFGDPRFAPRSRPADAAATTAEAATVTYRSAFDGSGGLERLRGSAREVRSAARFAPTATVRLRDGASEAWLRAAPLDSFRVLHFATHALVDDETASRTALALAPGEGHDGFLGPGDLAALRLDADLVVLSACRTAGGEVLRGEGVQGLTAPLLLAGARSVVATTWRIADQSTDRIVEGFYRSLAAGSSVSDALRESKLAALRAGAGSSEWAAFVALGDPATRVPLTLTAGTGWTLPLRWLAIGLGALLLVSAYLTMRKRSGAATT